MEVIFLGDTKGCVIRIIKFTTGCSDPNLYCPYIIFYVPRPTTCPFLKEIWQTTALEKKAKATFSHLP